MSGVYAHSAEAPVESGKWHLLEKHLKDVSSLAAQFGSKFGAGGICEVLGLMHDIGKADPAFQAYLHAAASGNPAAKVPHASPSAAVSQKHVGPFCLAIMAHHAGLPDSQEARTRLSNAGPETIRAATAFVSNLSPAPSGQANPPEWSLRDPLAAEMLLRMCFSALVDADYLDTERHFQSDAPRDRGQYPELDWYRDKLSEHMTRLQEKSDGSSVNRARQEILNACVEAAMEPAGAFRLTVPTGGGKTLAGLSFALKHGTAYGMNRVIFAIPYTSIIDQTAKVYGDIFGGQNVLEHHSAVDCADEAEGQSLIEIRRRLASENWDCPLVVTTTVQLFESLLANKPSRCRKLHNISRSVIVLDEVQALPPHLLEPILDVLDQLVCHYACSVVFCTATQPDYSGMPLHLQMIRNAREIVPNPQVYFERLRRVAFERIEAPVLATNVAESIDGHDRVLCVLNTRRDAMEVLKACRPGEDLFHLSTLMCPHHRKRTLETVRERLAGRLLVRLVTTQVVEAGVDLDFPVVMRDVGPLDRIVQVAGRCNREGRMTQKGRCILFELDSGRSPQGAYRTGIDLARTCVRENIGQLDDPDVIAGYFRALFGLTTTDRVRIEGRETSIQELRKRLCYQTVAENFLLIQDGTVPVVVLKYASDQINKILSEARFRHGRGWMRQLAPYTVAVRKDEYNRMLTDGLATIDETGIGVFTGGYSELYGIGSGDVRDPADLIQ